MKLHALLNQVVAAQTKDWQNAPVMEMEIENILVMMGNESQSPALCK